MAKSFQSIKDILRMIEKREITPQEGQRLIFSLKQSRLNEAPGEKEVVDDPFFDKKTTRASDDTKIPLIQPTNPTGPSNATQTLMSHKLPGLAAGYAEGANGDIAIIGLSCRFPGARNAEEFWQNLAAGKVTISEVPKDRWDWREYYDPDISKLDKTNCKWGGFLEDVDQFDPLFFNFSGKEAEMTDPQQRIFLEESWNALEDAGYATDAINNARCSVFVGAGNSDYLTVMQEEGAEREAHCFWGNASSVVAARISYFLNLKGPSVALDTACSSSLVAIHLGCQSILNGESDMVIAGGVFLCLTPYFHIVSSNAGMLSPNGTCSAFDNSANGFVPGEGVGAVILKSLKAALRDNDHIYGVIKSSGINQDGKTNGITAPSSISQAELETAVYHKAQINPETIQYIETHGTGTKLGDPIEIEALTKVFRKFTAKKQFCPIGSVKTNIGHTAMTAGVASVIKVLLALKHQRIPPSANYNTANEHIDFDNSPFYVNTALNEWKIKPGQPRRVVVSSFGFSGTNAHLVIEEAPQLRDNDPQTSQEAEPWYLVSLSAKSKDVLTIKVKELLEWLEREGKKHRIGDICYTLNMGRKHFPFRMALVIRNASEMSRYLKSCLSGEGGKDTCIHQSQTIPDKPDRAEKELCRRLLSEAHGIGHAENEYPDKLHALAELYVKGVDLDWAGFYQTGNYCRISLPTYPFVRERCWAQAEGKAKLKSRGQFEKLHALIDQNTSNFLEQKFKTQFTGGEFYIADHVVAGKKVLPGAAYLEMARAAGELSGVGKVRFLKEILWLKPILIKDNPLEVQVGLYPEEGSAHYEVSTPSTEGQKIIYAQGKIVFAGGEETNSQRTKLDIDAIKKRCTYFKSGADCYRDFLELGFQYGTGFRTLIELYGSETESLGQLELPAELTTEFSDFQLHPSLIDGALQTVLGVAAQREAKSGTPYLPFAMDEVEIVGPLSQKCYVFVKFAQSQDSSSLVKKYDIELADDDGLVAVKMKGFSLRRVNMSLNLAIGAEESPVVKFYRNEWEKCRVTVSDTIPAFDHILIFANNDAVLEAFSNPGKPTDTRIILIKPGESFRETGVGIFEINPGIEEDYRRLFETLRSEAIVSTNVKIIHMWCIAESPDYNQETSEDHLQSGIYSVFYLSKILLEQKLRDGAELLYVYGNKIDSNGARPDHYISNPWYAAMGGFAKTITQENRSFIYKTVEIQGEFDSWHKIFDFLLPEFQRASSSEVELRIARNVKYVKRLKEYQPGSEKEGSYPALPLKEKGVYLITGGAGGLGFIFAEYLSKQVQARLALCGRSDLNPGQQQRIRELEQIGAEVTYFKADVSNQQDVIDLITKAKSRFGRINGLIHSAGLTRDSFILNKTKEHLDEVLGPKVNGAVYLEQALQGEDIDFIVFFSSIAAEFGNVGQGDYAFANSFMDNYAEMKSSFKSDILQEKRPRKILSINWPLWEKGGMLVEDAALSWFKNTLGMVPLKTAEGITAFETGLKMAGPRLLVIVGEESKLNNLFEPKITALPAQTQTAVLRLTETEKGNLREKTETFLKNIISKIIRISPQKINSQEPFEKYGVDSVLIVNLNRELETKFGELSKTLFFEYQNLAGLVTYFIQNHREKLMALTGSTLSPQAERPVPKSVVLTETAPNSRKRFTASVPIMAEDNQQGEIAIIGLGGRYPQARNIFEFWENLKAGKDCITEIPDERWDWREYYNPDKNQGKVYTKWGGFIDDVGAFDSLFFNISPREAEFIDPQERLFLETVWQSLEDAGYTKSRLEDSTVGVFVGIMYGQYQFFGVEESLRGNLMALNSSYASIANRVSYYFNFGGPSIALDTMCSSSLTTIHLACESIRRNECNMAVAGGVNVSIHLNKYILLSRANFASTDGRCRSFGEGGDGYVPGEGVGAILLKSLKKAIADGDQIYAVIKGSSINHCGKTNGYTVPNPNAQAKVIAETLKKSRIDPRTISYLEAHGTGTSLGDPIEIKGLIKAFSEYTQDKQYCAIGSVKSNIGHLESAAGIAGITKVILQLTAKQLVPSLHSEILNPNIKFEETPFFVQRELAEWKQPVVEVDGIRKRYPRRAGISSFGAGGSNAHIIVEEYENPEQSLSEPMPGPYLIILSAKNQDRLKAYATELKHFLSKDFIPVYEVQNDINTVSPKLLLDLQDITAQILKIHAEEVDGAVALNELGLDQFGLIELVSGINNRFDLDINVNSAVDLGTLSAIARYLMEMYEDILVRHYAVNTVRDDKALAGATVPLDSVAYTLQIGREAMEERLAIMVENLDELSEKLSLYLEGKGEIGNLFTGGINNKHKLELLTEGEDEEQYLNGLINSLINKRRLAKLAQLWTSGIAIDWNLLYPEYTPKLISLPTYPLAREHHWAPVSLNRAVIRNRALDSEMNAPSDTEVSGGKTFEIAGPLFIPGSRPETPVVDSVKKITPEILEDELKSILGETLKLAPSGIEVDKNLAEYGVDSIISSVLLKNIEQRFGGSISLAAIAANPTIRELANYIKENITIDEIVLSHPVSVESSPVKAAINRKSNKLPPEIVPLNVKGSYLNSFFVHGAGGFAGAYTKLAEALGPEFPFYAFQAKGVNGQTMPHEFDEMVDHYLDCIRLVQPEGPYVIGGYSYGGLVAYEIAQRLSNWGEVISLLILLDTYPTMPEVTGNFDTKNDKSILFLKLLLGNDFANAKRNEPPLITAQDLEGIPPELQNGRIVKLIKERGKSPLPADDIYNYLNGIVRLNDYSLAAYNSYTIKPYEGSDVLFFKGTKGFVAGDNWLGTDAIEGYGVEDPVQTWRELVKRDLKIVPVSSDHFSMLEEPAIPIITENIKASLEQYKKKTV